MEFKDVEVIKANKSYEEHMRNIEKAKRYNSTVGVLTFTICAILGFLFFKSYVESRTNFILLILLSINASILYLTLVASYKIKPNIEYSHIFEASSVIAAKVINKSCVEIITENQLHEVERHTIDFCKVVERTDISHAVLNLEEKVFYIPYEGE